MRNEYINICKDGFNISQNIHHLLACIIVFMFVTPLYAQDIIAPPNLGEQTQGEPTKIKTLNDQLNENPVQTAESTDINATEQETKSLFGTTKISERRSENGQIYQIELEHANGSKQFINKNNDNGQLEPNIKNDTEETPNLAKWKLGSW